MEAIDWCWCNSKGEVTCNNCSNTARPLWVRKACRWSVFLCSKSLTISNIICVSSSDGSDATTYSADDETDDGDDDDDGEDEDEDEADGWFLGKASTCSAQVRRWSNSASSSLHLRSEADSASSPRRSMRSSSCWISAVRLGSGQHTVPDDDDDDDEREVEDNEEDEEEDKEEDEGEDEDEDGESGAEDEEDASEDEGGNADVICGLSRAQSMPISASAVSAMFSN